MFILHVDTGGFMQVVVWRKFEARSRQTGLPFEAEPFVPYESGILLLKQILQMPRAERQALDYDEACQLFMQAYHQRPKPSLEALGSSGVVWRKAQEDSARFRNSFVEWVSQQGYYIELTHQEYQPRYGDQ